MCPNCAATSALYRASLEQLASLGRVAANVHDQDAETIRLLREEMRALEAELSEARQRLAQHQ